MVSGMVANTLNPSVDENYPVFLAPHDFTAEGGEEALISDATSCWKEGRAREMQLSKPSEYGTTLEKAERLPSPGNGLSGVGQDSLDLLRPPSNKENQK